ncbi:MAG: hypothetical protein MUP19_04895 [Candidatus Aminicenantes bacterium]|jgi:hypothetical protein|nr:hypothetical protein [Candidatus Aminicenantes bacterium]
MAEEVEPLLGEGDLFSRDGRIKGTSLFLGRYSPAEVIALLGRRNFFKAAKQRRLWPLEFDVDSSEFPRQRFRIYQKSAAAENLIVDLKIREGLFQVKSHLTLGLASREYKVLVFEWLTLQNPLLKFGPSRPPLPGQACPGLGLGRKVMDLFMYLARIMGQDGLLAFPAYFHNALLFSHSFIFANPDKAGEVAAVQRALRRIPIKKQAWIVHWGCLRDRSGRPYEWKAEEQVCPLSKSLRKHFSGRLYRMKARLSRSRHKFTVDWESFRAKAAEVPGLLP